MVFPLSSPSRTHRPQKLGTIGALLLLSCCLIWDHAPVQAQSRRLSVWQRLSRIWAGQSLGPASSSGRVAASRSGGSCQAMNPPLTALMPLDTTASHNQAIGTTTAAYPTFWFYLPYALTPDRPAELLVERPDPTDPRYTQQRLLMQVTAVPAGVVGLRLPPTEAPLTVNQPYHLKLVVRCNPQDASANQFVDATIVRLPVPASLQQQVQTASPREQARLYASAGFWEDAVTTLATLRRQAPQNAQLATAWETLLAEVELTPIANRPIVNCCEPKQRAGEASKKQKVGDSKGLKAGSRL
jgi:hypothetical protein